MEKNTYGVLVNGAHVDVSRTLRGAKNYATRHGYNIVSIRYNCGYIAQVLAMKKGRGWIYINEVPQVKEVTNPLYLSTQEKEID